MASMNNVPKDILDSMRECLDRRVKLSIKRLVNYETRKDKTENRVLAFSTYRLFIFTAKSAKDTKLESSIHYLEIKGIESKKPNQLVLTTASKSYSFTTLEADTDEVNHMITHIGTSLKTIFPAFPVERMLKKIDVQPPDRLNLMNDLIHTIEKKETGPCGGFTLMYACMCDFHNLTYRDEVAWDVDTIYLSQECRELNLRDFDHLKERDLVPIVSALVHNTWFTSLNANNVKLSAEVCNEILRVMKKNGVIEALLLSNTGISTEFIKKLSTLSMTDTQLHKLDLSNNAIDDLGAEHIFGALSSRGRRFTWLDLSKTKVTSKGLNRISEAMNRSPHVFSCVQTLVLNGLTSGNKVDDLQNLYTFLASPNMITHLDLSGTDVELDKLMAPLQRGCSQNITTLKLARTVFSNKKVKEVVVQPSFKQFFATVSALKHIDLSGAKIPPEAFKDLMTGLNANRNLKDIHLDISGIDLSGYGTQYLQNCLAQNIVSLNISNIVFSDNDLVAVLNSIGQSKHVKVLSVGRVFQNVKPRNLKSVLEELINIVQDEESVIESLSLADSKLKDNMNMIINALGSNTSLTEIDISGNYMGDLGARMLSKALQINNKLHTIFWDCNNTTNQGFEDIADALEKNYTLRKMPMPVYDATAALRTNPEKTEQALQTIERLLQRNHSPQKYSSDQAYRLQQGFLISSTQQMVDRLVVQSQDTINALTAMDAVEPYSDDINTAKAIIKDADNSKTLLPRLHDIAIQSQNANSPVAQKLKEVSKELTAVLEAQMKKTVEDMLENTRIQCKMLMAEQGFLSDLKEGCKEKSALPKDFTSNILNDVDTGIFNQLSELNLAVAAHMSDRIIDEVIERLSHSHKTLTNHLNECKKGAGRRSEIAKSQKMEENEAQVRSKENSSPLPEKEVLHVPVPRDSPKMKEKRKSMHARKIRPQSVVENQVQLALEEDKKRPVTMPQRTQTKSRSPQNRSPKPPRSHDSENKTDYLKPEKSSRKKSRSPGDSSRSPSASPRSHSPIPSIEVTSENMDGLDSNPLYDNAVPRRRPRKHRGCHDGLDSGPELSIPKKQASKEPEIDLDHVPDLPTAPKLTHATKDRARRVKNVRPTTRQSDMPHSVSSDSLKVDENLDEFFSKPSAPEKVARTPSTKSTPESKKKLGGFFSRGSKEKDNDKVTKKHGLLSRLHVGGSPKTSAHEKNRISDVQEASDESSANNNNFLTSQADDINEDEVTPHGSLEKKPKKSDTSEKISNKSDSLDRKSQKSDKSDSLDRKSSSGKSDSSSVTASDNDSKKTKEHKEEKESQSEESDSEKEEKERQREEEDKSVELPTETKTEEKLPLKPPSVKRSVSKGDKKEEKEESTPEVTSEKKDTVPEESKKESLKVKEETEKKEEVKENTEAQEPVKQMRKPMIPGGIGLGIDLKAIQEKRNSMMPPKLVAAGDKPANTNPAAEEHKSPFGVGHLKPVSKSKLLKESDQDSNNSNTPVKPADNKKSDSVKSAESSLSEKKAGKLGSDKKDYLHKGDNLHKEDNVHKGDNVHKLENGNPDAKAEKHDSFKENHGEKPVINTRPGGLGINKPATPSRPKPTPPSNKPTPAPRRSLTSTDGTEPAIVTDENVEGTNTDVVEKKVDRGGVVYDSATLKLSVKDKISKFKNTGSEEEGAKGKSPSSSESAKGKPLSHVEKLDSLFKKEGSETDKNETSLTNDKTKHLEVKSDDVPKESSVMEDKETSGDQDLKKVMESSEMTDSGIVHDVETPKSSVKDALSKFGAPAVSKSDSLPKSAKPSDMRSDSPGASRRPHSMFAVLENNPILKKHTDTKTDIPEETSTAIDTKTDNEDKNSPTEDVILV